MPGDACQYHAGSLQALSDSRQRIVALDLVRIGANVPTVRRGSKQRDPKVTTLRRGMIFVLPYAECLIRLHGVNFVCVDLFKLTFCIQVKQKHSVG